MTRDDLAELYPDDALLFCDGFDECIVGVCHRFGQSPVVAYNLAQMLDVLEKRDGMTYEEAQEFFDFNIIGAWVGDYTPCFIDTHTV